MISVVIPHLNQPQMLARGLDALMAGRRRPDEVIVVDNGSTVPPEAVCAAYPGVRLLHEPTPGPGPARNRGVAAAQGDILAFIDADCIADPGWLEEAERAMADAAILGGDVRIAMADPQRPTMLEAYESIYAYRMDRYIAREGYTGTGNLVIRRSVFDTVGPFAGLDVAEDRDWGRRATALGLRPRYVAAMRVFHPARPDLADLFRKWDRHTAHFYAEARNRRGGLLVWAAKTGLMVVSPLAEIPRILRCDRVSGARARALAFAGIVRIRLYRAGLMARLMVEGDPERLSSRWNRPAA